MSIAFSSELEKYAEQHNLPITIYHPGQHIFTEGNIADGLYYILDNYSKILKYDLKHNNTFLWFAKPKELIGVTSFYQGEGNYTCSAVAGELPCKAIFFPKDQFVGLLKHLPTLKHRLLRTLCERINFMEMRTKNLRFK